MVQVYKAGGVVFMEKIILASASPRRKMLLNQIGVSFEVMVSDVEEKINYELPPDELVKELSRQKAMNVAKRLGEGFLVIGADTVVVFDGRILGKPKDKEDAFKMLFMLQGHWHEVYTGVTIIKTKDMLVESDCEKTEVYMRKLSSSLINQYINTGEPLDKAGAYGIQEKGGLFIDKINGDYNNVVGLPVKLIVALAEKMGVDLYQNIFKIRS